MTQSEVKGFEAYLHKGECGEYFKQRWLDNNPKAKAGLKSQAIKAGLYFEYLCVGIVHKGEKPPQPDYMKGRKEPTLLKIFADAKVQSDNFFSICRQMKIRVVNSNKRVSKNGDSGTYDIKFRWDSDEPYTITKLDGEVVVILEKGSEFIADLKYSGTLYDKWSEFGWEDLQLKENTLAQARHYTMITGLPFFFFVFSSKDQDARFFYIHVSKDEMGYHKDRIENAKRNIELEKEIGFTPRPQLKRCRECPLFDTCKYKTTIPRIEPIIL